MSNNDEFSKAPLTEGRLTEIEKMPGKTPQQIIEILKALRDFPDKELAYRYSENTVAHVIELLRQSQRAAVEAHDPEIGRLRQQIRANRARLK